MKSILSILCLISIVSCSDSSRALQNENNIKKVKVGMHYNKVEEIMDKPIIVNIQPLYPEEFVSVYNAPIGMSDNYRISFSRKDSMVIRIGYGD